MDKSEEDRLKEAILDLVQLISDEVTYTYFNLPGNYFTLLIRMDQNKYISVCIDKHGRGISTDNLDTEHDPIIQHMARLGETWYNNQDSYKCDIGRIVL